MNAGALFARPGWRSRSRLEPLWIQQAASRPRRKVAAIETEFLVEHVEVEPASNSDYGASATAFFPWQPK